MVEKLGVVCEADAQVLPMCLWNMHEGLNFSMWKLPPRLLGRTTEDTIFAIKELLYTTMDANKRWVITIV